MSYTSKAIGTPLIWLGVKVMIIKSLRELNCLKPPSIVHIGIKAPTFSFMKLKGVDPILGVEMTSTGEVACIDYSFARDYIKALMASNLKIPKPNKPVLITVRDEDREYAVQMAYKLKQMGYQLFATKETVDILSKAGIDNIKNFRKVHE